MIINQKKEEEPEINTNQLLSVFPGLLSATVFSGSEDFHIRKSWTKNLQYKNTKQFYRYTETI